MTRDLLLLDGGHGIGLLRQNGDYEQFGPASSTARPVER
jgi:hypothetical protein